MLQDHESATNPRPWKNKNKFKTENMWGVRGMKRTPDPEVAQGTLLSTPTKRKPFHSLLVKPQIFTHNLRHSHNPHFLLHLSRSSGTPHCVGWPGAYANPPIPICLPAPRGGSEEKVRRRRGGGVKKTKKKTGTHTRQVSAAPGEHCTLRSRWAVERRRRRRRKTMRKR